ncbi:SDR family oxidoreductase [Fluviicola sp.]|uniref:SDR family oxidoreductase n=1 Tax=Fluviicola sp. TaxID=1917219 RepID=UPI0031E3065A
MKKLMDYLPVTVADKNVLVTGGTAGIGRATALLLASLGARVMIFGRHREELDETLGKLNEAWGERDKTGNNKVIGMIADASEKDDVAAVFKRFDDEFGTIDVLINNAAIGYGSVLEGSHEDRNYMLSTNVDGYLMCVHEAAKRMKQNGSGHIINIGSMSAETRDGGSSMYVAAKAAIQGFSVSLRKELNPYNIHVTLIEPGAVLTDMQEGFVEDLEKKVQNEEMLEAQDIAWAIIFCLSQPKRCSIVSLQIKPLMQEI